MSRCSLKILSENYSTILVDRLENHSCRNTVHGFLHCDFTNTEKLLETLVLRNICPDIIIALNDFAVKPMSEIAKYYNCKFWNREEAECLTSKSIMKKKWVESSVMTPRHINVDKNLEDKDSLMYLISALNFPLFIKPSFSGGGSRGVYQVNSYGELKEKFESISPLCLDNSIIIEETVYGTEHTVEVLYDGANPHILSISDKLNYSNSPSIVQYLTFPGPIGNRHRKKIQNTINNACKALGLSSPGALHFEIISTKNGEIYVIEVGGRPGGGLNFDPICRLSTGNNYPILLARLLSEEVVNVSKKKEDMVLKWCYLDIPETGVIKQIVGWDKIDQRESVVSSNLNVSAGQIWSPMKNDLERPGYILLKSTNLDEIEKEYRLITKDIKFVIKPLNMI